MDAKNPREVLAYVPPSREKIRLLTAPLRHFFSPVFLDLEKAGLVAARAVGWESHCLD
ncbi:MAG: hypothetical protein U0787_01085 [Polyangia bacterium]